MTRVLSRTVVAGGVVYPARTPATEELEALVPDPKHWSEDEPPGGDADETPKPAARKRAAKKSTQKG